MKSGDTETALKQGYEQTSFAMESYDRGRKEYEMPVSEAATYRMSGRPDPQTIKRALDSKGYSFIAPHSELCYLSSKVYDTETNEFFHIKINGNTLQVYPKDEDFSFETFKRFVQAFNKHAAEIELEVDDGN